MQSLPSICNRLKSISLFSAFPLCPFDSIRNIKSEIAYNPCWPSCNSPDCGRHLTHCRGIFRHPPENPSLRLLYEKGEEKNCLIPIRIAATNADLAKRVAEGRFREDLFYRINVISLTIPPLRERSEDIIPLACDFLSGLSRVSHKPISGFAPDAKQVLQHYSWPGNVRELHNTVERAVILGTGEKIGRKDLPDNIVPAADIPAIGDPVSLAKIEELHIRRVIARTASFQEAADVLGIDQATLWRRRKVYGI